MTSRSWKRDGLAISSAQHVYMVLESTADDHGNQVGHGLLIIKFKRQNARLVEPLYCHTNWLVDYKLDLEIRLRN